MKTAHQCQFLIPYGAGALLPDIKQGRPEPGQSVGIEGAGLQCSGHGCWMGLRIGHDAASSRQQRAHLNPLPDAYPPGSLGPHQSLMPCKTQDVYIIPIHINGKHARCLGRVHQEQGACLPAPAPNPPDIHQIAGKVGSMGAHHGFGSRGNGCLQGIVIQRTLMPFLFISPIRVHFPGTPNHHQIHALALHLIKRAQHAVMFQRRGHHPVPGGQHAFNGNIQALRGISRKCNLLRSIPMEQS